MIKTAKFIQAWTDKGKEAMFLVDTDKGETVESAVARAKEAASRQGHRWLGYQVIDGHREDGSQEA